MIKLNQSPRPFDIVGSKQSDHDKISRPSLTFWKDAWLRLKKNKGAVAGLIVATVITLLAVFAPMLSNYTYKQQDLSKGNLPPKIPYLEKISWLGFDGKMKDINGAGTGQIIDYYQVKNETKYHYFGTDEFGRDIWTRVWYGTRISLIIGFLAAIIDFLIGVAYGGISGYFGGKVDIFMQRFAEILVGIPYLIVVILFIILFKAGLLTLVLAMVVTGWVTMSRIVRGQFLKLRNQEFVMASQTLGASNWRIIVKHLLPNSIGPVLISVMFTIPSAIFYEAFLSFIGLGIPQPEASLGTMVNDGIANLDIFPFMLIIPAVVISLLILSFNLIADGLRDALDPKMRK